MNPAVPCGACSGGSLRRRKYDGRDPYLPLYFAVKGEVFDVSKGRDFYGPGAPLSSFFTPGNRQDSGTIVVTTCHGTCQC